MNKKYPVMWYQGLPVGPEVFQQNFLYTENQIQSIFQVGFTNAWGIKTLDIDESEIEKGILKIKKLLAVAKNYSLVSVDIDTNDDLMIDLTLYKEELKNQSLFLYISFPNNDYTEQNNISNPKYIEIIQEVSDLNNTEEKTELKFLKQKYFLEIAKTDSLKNISIPLAKITYNGMNYKISEYCPPTFNIKTSKLLHDNLSSLISLMKDKLNFLKNTKTTLENYMLLSNVSNILFSLEKCLKCNCHPYELYSNLVHAVGCSFVFAKSTTLPNITEYKHDNILDIMKELINYIEENIKAITVTCVQKQFEKQSTQTMTLFSIEAPTKTKNNIVIIGVERNKAAEYQEMYAWIENSIIATADKISATQSQRTLGAKRTLIKNFDELNLPKIENLIIIGIEIKNQFISQNEPICILNFDENTPSPEAIYLIENS